MELKKTKILCTIGPASIDRKIIKNMYVNGMNACRINSSHGNFKQYKIIIRNVRSAGDAPIILDTQGSGVRITNKDQSVKRGEIIDITLSVNVYKNLRNGVKVLINDGLIEGVIVNVGNKLISVRINNDGELVNNRKIIFRNCPLNLPVLTERDKKSLKFARKNNLEFIGLSYTRSRKDVEYVKKLLKNSGILIIAKIEDREGVKNYKEIINASDALMVARGDLGTGIPSEKIPLIQKEIIKECNKAGKPVIVATQMMESMVNNNSPTRAETSDVANAILDGADCLMLSAETSIGKYPRLAVKMMARICINAENSNYPVLETRKISIVDNITSNAFKIADDMNARILCKTRSGYTAKMISRFKPGRELIALTGSEIVAKQLMISYGVKPLMLKSYDNYDARKLTQFCVKNKLINNDDLIVFVAGLFIKKTTNTIIVFKASDLL